jgi:hypothetical protein
VSTTSFKLPVRKVRAIFGREYFDIVDNNGLGICMGQYESTADWIVTAINAYYGERSACCTSLLTPAGLCARCGEQSERVIP